MSCADDHCCQTAALAKSTSTEECCSKGAGQGKDQLQAQVTEERKRTAESKSLHAAFGEVVNLLSQTAAFEKLPLGKLKTLVWPAIGKGQFAILEGRDETRKVTAPVAAMLWANVSEEIDRRLSDSGSPIEPLKDDEWDSGEIPWLLLAVGDNKLLPGLKAHVEKAVNAGRPFKYRRPAGGEMYS